MKKRNRGFSMVELMVAVTLGLLVTGAVISVFVGSRSAYQSTAGVGSVADSGRFALDMIQQSGRGAGFMECNHATVNSSLSLLNSLGSPLAYDFRYGVGGFEAVGTGLGGAAVIPAATVADGSLADWNPNLDVAFTFATTKQVKGSDVLVLRSSVDNATPAYTTADVAPGANTLLVTGPASLQAGQLAVISDCTKSVTFQISNLAAGSPATVGFSGAVGPPGNATVALPVGFSAGALVSPVTTVVYYIGVGDDGDGALRRLDIVNGNVNGGLIFTDEEIAPEVENMQVLYGVDTTGTLAASSYVTADQVLNWNSVVSIKVAVLSASPPGATPLPAAVPPPFNLLGTLVTVPRDTRIRKVFDVTITLRNSVN